MPLERRDVDILTMGRSGIDIYPLQVGVHLEDVETFGKFLGGSPTNVAVAAARLGHRTGVITWSCGRIRSIGVLSSVPKSSGSPSPACRATPPLICTCVLSTTVALLAA